MGAENKGDTRSRPGSPDDATSLTATWVGVDLSVDLGSDLGGGGIKVGT
jgi:hypothetical protein